MLSPPLVPFCANPILPKHECDIMSKLIKKDIA